jgi:hypothetical protein
MAQAIRAIVREQLPQFSGGAMEIASELMAKRTLSEFEVESAFARGQRSAREQAERSGGVAKRDGQVVRRRIDLSKPEDVVCWQSQQLNPNAQPFFYRSAELLTDTFKWLHGNENKNTKIVRTISSAS